MLLALFVVLVTACLRGSSTLGSGNCTGDTGDTGDNCTLPEDIDSPAPEEEGGRIVHHLGQDILVCPPFSCAGRCHVPNNNLTLAACFCDDLCAFYGDCCVDFYEECDSNAMVVDEIMLLSDQRPQCAHIFMEQYAVVVNRCHGNWSEEDGIRQCEDVAEDDALTVVPVTHQKTRLAFRNIHCAMCNWVNPSEVEFWEFFVTCNDDEQLDVIRDNDFDLTLLREHLSAFCQVRLRPHDAESHNVRYCDPKFVDGCGPNDDSSENEHSTNRSKAVQEDACSRYVAYVVAGDGEEQYVAKNTHCALCANNSFTVNDLYCPRTFDITLSMSLRVKFFNIAPFSLILDFNGFHWMVGEATAPPPTVPCEEGTWGLHGECRETACMPGWHRDGDMCLPQAQNDTDILIELVVGGPGNDNSVSSFRQMLSEEATEHGLVMGNISTESPHESPNDFPVRCRETVMPVASSDVIDYDLVLKQSETSFSALLEYIDDVIDSAQSKLAKVKVRNSVGNMSFASICPDVSTFSLVNTSDDVFLVSDDGVLHDADDVVWEITWILGCVDGWLRPTKTKSVKGCFRRTRSCLLVELTEDERRELSENSNITGVHIVTIDGGFYVCSSDLADLYPSSPTTVSSDSQYAERILTAVLLPLSMLALVFTILTHCVIHRLRSLPGKIVLSLSLALLLAQALFLTLQSAAAIKWLCTTIAVTEHFFWLSTFAWSNILSLDLEITLTRSTKVGGNKENWHTFLRYSVYAWGTPFMVVTVVVLLSFLTSLPITYGNQSVCWLQGGDALLFAFALPVAVAVLVNSLLLSRAIYFVWKVGKLVKNASIMEDQKAKTFLYVKLSLLMGVTWTFGFLGTLVGSSVLMYLFTVSNSLQGVYIFLAFAANRRVFSFYLKRVRGKFGRPITSVSSGHTATAASKLSSN